MCNDNNRINNQKFLGFLILTYSMVIVLANWFDPRLIHIFGLDTDGGTIIFPLTFLLADLITEVYGYKHARRAIWYGFLFNAIFVVYGQIIIHLPGPAYANNNALFDKILGLNARIIFASTISYLIAEPLNSFIMAKLKIKLRGGYMGTRFALSTAAASGVDSLFFGSLAFYGLMNNYHLVLLILTMWFIKVFVEILGLPISVKLSKLIKKLEARDIYDRRTKFNVFNLETNYTLQDNEYDKAEVI